MLHWFQVDAFTPGYVAILIISIVGVVYFSLNRRRGFYITYWLEINVYTYGVSAILSLVLTAIDVEVPLILLIDVLFVHVGMFAVFQFASRFPTNTLSPSLRSTYRLLSVPFVLGIAVNLLLVILAMTGHRFDAAQLVMDSWILLEVVIITGLARWRWTKLTVTDPDLAEMLDDSQATQYFHYAILVMGLMIMGTAVIVVSNILPRWELVGHAQRITGVVILLFLSLAPDAVGDPAREKLPLFITALALCVALGIVATLSIFLVYHPLMVTSGSIQEPQLIWMFLQLQVGASLLIVLGVPLLTRLAMPAPKPAAVDTTPDPPHFTNRQRDVLYYLADGLTNGEIAARLVVTEDTVKYHIRMMLRRSSFSDRYEMGAYARQERQAGRLTEPTND